MKEKYIYLDASRLSRLVGVNEYKHWWLAEQVGIHKTTLRRWLRGSIRQIHERHLEKLTELLGESVEQNSG